MGSAAAENTVKLTVTVSPEAASASAKISVDGKEISGTSLDVPNDRKSVRIVVTASGYHAYDKRIEIQAGMDPTVPVVLIKRASGGSPGFGGASNGKPEVPRVPPSNKKKPGVIDI
jgi:hypothetical protein